VERFTTPAKLDIIAFWEKFPIGQMVTVEGSCVCAFVITALAARVRMLVDMTALRRCIESVNWITYTDIGLVHSTPKKD
jgi:hypothetical protein